MDDSYREMAGAQTFLDEGFGCDFAYRGEHIWYNPLTPSVAALGQRALGIPLPILVARMGPYVNLIGPVAFYVATVCLVDSWTALAALAALLFITANADVFLTTDDRAIYLIGPAGRKVVATNRYYSHPYVDWQRRDADRLRLFDLIRRADVAGFDQLAASYGVTYALVAHSNDPWLERMGGVRVGESLVVREAELAMHPSLGEWADKRGRT